MIQKICQFFFYKVLGWRIAGDVPQGVDKYIFVVLPHTSNWDFVYGWMAIRALDLDVTIFVKDAFFVWPLTYACRFFGVAPVNRRESTNFVDSIAQQFEEREKLIALITPEGTRKFNPELKSGYYYLALKADVPIVMAGPDYLNKSFKVLPLREPRDSFAHDVIELVEFCKTQNAYWPEKTFH